MQDAEGHFTAHGTRMREHALALRGLALVAILKGSIKELWTPLLKGHDFTLAAQNPETGGWRFVPDAKESDVIETTQQVYAVRLAHVALYTIVNGGAPTEDELRTAADLRCKGAVQAASDHIAAHWIRDPANPQFGGFRFQLAPAARVSMDTTAQGLLALAMTTMRQTDGWTAAHDRFMALREDQERDGGRWSRHFLALEADLAATRALETLAHGKAEWIPQRDAWRAQELARLTALERPGGGWSCDVGPGDAYFTAAKCLRLARPER